MAADELLRSDPGLRESIADIRLVLEQTVSRHDADPLTWHVVFDHGDVALAAGPADRPDVTLTCTETVARAINQGSTSAQSAFMTGELRIGGDIAALLAHAELLSTLTDALAPLRT